MASRQRTSPEQFCVLVEFMERNGDLARPQKGPQGRIQSDRLWEEVKQILNSTGGGVPKSTEKWKKVWADWKTKTKTKALQIRRHQSGTGGGPSLRICLTALEERVLAIIGVSAVDGQEGIGEQGFHILVEPPALSLEPSTSSHQPVNFINLDYEYDLQVAPGSPQQSSGHEHAPLPSTSRGLPAASTARVRTTEHNTPSGEESKLHRKKMSETFIPLALQIFPMN